MTSPLTSPLLTVDHALSFYYWSPEITGRLKQIIVEHVCSHLNFPTKEIRNNEANPWSRKIRSQKFGFFDKTPYFLTRRLLFFLRSQLLNPKKWQCQPYPHHIHSPLPESRKLTKNTVKFTKTPALGSPISFQIYLQIWKPQNVIASPLPSKLICTLLWYIFQNAGFIKGMAPLPNL